VTTRSRSSRTNVRSALLAAFQHVLPEVEKYFRTIIQVFSAPEPATAARRQSLNDGIPTIPRPRTE